MDPSRELPSGAGGPLGRRARPAVAVLAAALMLACADESGERAAPPEYNEHLKDGGLALTIVGDYFHHGYVSELAHIAKALSPDARQVLVCDAQYERALRPFLAANGVENVVYHTLPPSSAILRQWARDIAVAGTRGGVTTLVVSPDKHARSKEEAEATGIFLRTVFPGHVVRIAPFVFEGGNLAFVRTRGQRVLIVGRKVLHDNAVYQKQTWAAGLDHASLLEAIAETFGVDRVLVAGSDVARPDTRMYFEYHIDMGMVVLDGERAVVSRLDFGDAAGASLARAVTAGHPVLTPFAGPAQDSLRAVLSARLRAVAREYEDYAVLLKGLGVEVHRSPVGWQHVLASMSWTNVAQVGNRILMPLYPDSLLGVTTAITADGGRLRTSLDVSRIEGEAFELRDLNQLHRELYESLGYEVVPVPEYLHYMMGGIHCFVNVLE